ncbi:MAG: hypothetical protein POG24_05405 [Acidocella sp.]|nr:hypothetical protein [Acidocella sp.]
MFTKKSIVLCVLLSLSSCIAPDSVTIQMANEQVLCSGKSDCDAKWSKALEWVVQNAAYTVNIQTDDLIQTNGPFQNDVTSRITITKILAPDGSGQFIFNSQCDNVFGCNPSGVTLKASFNTFVNH